MTGALAALLGGVLECIVVSDAEHAAGLLQDLAEGKKGRASVIPVSPHRTTGQVPRAPLQGAGVVAPLIDLLKYAPEDAALVSALVGDAVLVEDYVAAWGLLPEAEGRTLVARDGTVSIPTVASAAARAIRGPRVWSMVSAKCAICARAALRCWRVSKSMSPSTSGYAMK